MLGEKLFPCLDKGPTSIPCNRINMVRARPSFITISTAETGTIQLEFRDLARVKNEEKYEVDTAVLLPGTWWWTNDCLFCVFLQFDLYRFSQCNHSGMHRLNY